MDFRQLVSNSYGSQALASIERFQNIQIDFLKSEFHLEADENQIQDYINQIQSLFRPQKFRKPSSVHESSQNKPKIKGVEISPQMLKVKLDSKNYMGSEYRNRGDDGDVPLEVLEDEEGTEPNIQMNRSKKFDFRRCVSNLKISLVKGLQMENIELYDELSMMLKANREIYTDEMFPPAISSLTPNLKEFPLAQKVAWKRISDFYNPKTITLCSDQIGPNDIQQGKLGNCYFLSALSVLGEKHEFIKRLFHAKEVNSVGCYSVWLCDSGEWKNIIIDDYIPCLQSPHGQFAPCFSKSKGHDIWVLLLEKAFAKLFGSYYCIDGGLQSEAFGTLTGAPTKEFIPKENLNIDVSTQMWDFLQSSLKHNFIVTAASKSQSQILNKQSMGIVSSHAYAVLDAQEVSLENGTREKIIKMRNPWGRYEWRGAWGDNSPHWTSKIKKQLNYESQDEDGIFWMNLADFDAHFDQICRCEVHPDYYFSFLKLGENGIQNKFLARLTLSNDGLIYVNLQQKMKKHFRKNPDYDYSFVRLILIKLDQNGKVESLVHAKYKQRQCLVLRKEVKKGQYLVLAEIDWIQQIYNQVNLTVYSNSKIEMQEEKVSDYYALVLYKAFTKAYCQQPGNSHVVTKQYEHEGKQLEAFKYKIDKFGFIVLMYQNNADDYILNVRLQIKELKNLDIYYPEKHNSMHAIQLKVLTGQTGLVILKAKVLDPEDPICSYSYGEIAKFSQNLSSSNLKQLCLSQGEKTQAFNDGSIQVYHYKYAGGFADFYVHKGLKGVFEEEITFDLKNFLVNGAETSNLKITLPPGQEFLLDLKVQNIFDSSSYSRKSKRLIK